MELTRAYEKENDGVNEDNKHIGIGGEKNKKQRKILSQEISRRLVERTECVTTGVIETQLCVCSPEDAGCRLRHCPRASAGTGVSLQLRLMQFWVSRRGVADVGDAVTSKIESRRSDSPQMLLIVTSICQIPRH
ncbi:hypothetical protein H6P81_019099 [Aristolochia fimbriata]|uniref:Uncharacterized protein n=1 Tax=Aristolochia fimbriata TaxID=158543 RepID=A0AAV7DQV6_ARIFI|nr:hypothetical protein H6P81_019099 [Aristolochia fimbriata]